MHNPHISFRSLFCVFLVLLILRCADLALTYKITPDLSLEWNPIVSNMGLSWPGFLSVQFSLVLFALWGFYHFSKRDINHVKESNLSFNAYVTHYFSGKKLSIRECAQRIFRMPEPSYLHAHGAFVGFVIVSGYIITSIFAIFHNILILIYIEPYIDFIQMAESTYFVSMFISIILLSVAMFFILEYKQYQRGVEY